MSSVQLLNHLGKMRSGYVPIDTLEEDYSYKIKSFEKYENKHNDWGDRVRVNLEDGRYVILPVRFNYLFKKDKLKKINKDKLCLVYKGKDGTHTMVEFKNQTEPVKCVKKQLKPGKISLKDIMEDNVEVVKDDDDDVTD